MKIYLYFPAISILEYDRTCGRVLDYSFGQDYPSSSLNQWTTDRSKNTPKRSSKETRIST
eukprot:UN09320